MQFNITEFINTCVTNIEAWLPTATSIVSALICCVWGVARIKKAANDLKSDKTIQELRAEIENDLAENKEARKVNKMLIDKLIKVKRIEDEENGSNGEEI